MHFFFSIPAARSLFSRLPSNQFVTIFQRTRSNSMDSLPPSDQSDARIRDGFHRQIGEYGHELSSFVSAELGEPPSGLSITLETIEWPESSVNWVPYGSWGALTRPPSGLSCAFSRQMLERGH
jgi:hypothetical protein